MKNRWKYILIPTIGLFFISFKANKDKLFEIVKNIEIFTNVYKELNTHYVDDLDPNQLMKTGIDAMMKSLDPYTVYYSESQIESHRISDDGTYNGLGAQGQEVDGLFTIVEIYKDGPAYKAGLLVGDQVVSVNGESADGKTYDDILRIIRGFPGTDVRLGIKNSVTGQISEKTVTRSRVDKENVPYFGQVADGIGYISLTTFTRKAGNNIANAYRQLREDNPSLKGLILDLRSNGGGLLSEAVDILGIFLPQGSPVVSTKGKVIDRDQNYSTKRTPIDVETPLVILTNGRSASASEIVSGSIQDYDRGVILGQRTYGKGLVQNFREVGYNSRIKVTISKYYIPSGRCIQSIEYENGEHKDIPDSLRAVFYTRNGRKVLDGGGVLPDVQMSAFDDPEIIQALKSKNMIFKYVNQYMENYSAPDTISDLAYTDYNEFVNFIKDQDFQYSTLVQQDIEKLEKSVQESNNQSLLASIKSIKSHAKSNLDEDLSKYKDEISRIIEIDIAQRLFFERGKVIKTLNRDIEVEKAIELINNPREYNKLLNK